MIVVLGRDLITFSRIAQAAAATDRRVIRIDDPSELPAAHEVRLAFVDWGDRRDGWADALQRWLQRSAPASPRVVLFGPHTDRQAHDEARAAGLGPMLARSRLIAVLPDLVAA